jgi:uncharacterized protein YkvS
LSVLGGFELDEEEDLMEIVADGLINLLYFGFLVGLINSELETEGVQFGVISGVGVGCETDITLLEIGSGFSGGRHVEVFIEILLGFKLSDGYILQFESGTVNEEGEVFEVDSAVVEGVECIEGVGSLLEEGDGIRGVLEILSADEAVVVGVNFFEDVGDLVCG